MKILNYQTIKDNKIIMADNYTLCPNCGTRNFKDDGVCGVCKAKLVQSPSSTNDTPIAIIAKSKAPVRKATLNKKKVVKTQQQKSSAGTILLFVIIGLIAFYYSIDGSGNSKPKEDLITNSTYDASVVQVERYLKDKYLKDPDS